MRIITSLFALLLGVIGSVIGIFVISGMLVLSVMGNTWVANASTQLNEAISNQSVAAEEHIAALSSEALTDFVNEINRLANVPAEDTIDISVAVSEIEQDIEPRLAELVEYFKAVEPYRNILAQFAPVFSAVVPGLPEGSQAMLQELLDEGIYGELLALQKTVDDAKYELRRAQRSDALPLTDIKNVIRELTAAMSEAQVELEQIQTVVPDSSVLTSIGGRARTAAIIAIAAIVLLIWWATWAQWSLMRSGWRGLQNRY